MNTYPLLADSSSLSLHFGLVASLSIDLSIQVRVQEYSQILELLRMGLKIYWNRCLVNAFFGQCFVNSFFIVSFLSSLELNLNCTKTCDWLIEESRCK